MEKRKNPRWPVTLLAKCLVSEGKKIFEFDMWVMNVSEGGVLLQLADDSSPPFQNQKKDFPLQKSCAITIQGLFYDEEGPHGRKGRIRWVRRAFNGEGPWIIGIKFTDRPLKSKEVFHDFMNVVSHIAVHTDPPAKKTLSTK
jgi:hypothetical protein